MNDKFSSFEPTTLPERTRSMCLLKMRPRHLLRVSLLIILVLAGITGCSSGDKKSSKTQDKFFNAVASGDAQQVMDLLDPEIQKEVDLAFLKSWVKAFNNKYGEYRGLSWTDFKTGFNVDSAGKHQHAEGTFKFEHGSVKSKFKYLNGNIVSFNVEIPDTEWQEIFLGIDPTAYADLNKEFLTKLFAGEVDDVRASTLFREDEEFEKLKHISQLCQENLGALNSVKLLHSQWLPTDKPNNWKLTSVYRCEAEQQTRNIVVRLSLDGMKGRISGVDLEVDQDFPLDEIPEDLAKLAEPLIQAIKKNDAAEISLVLKDLKSKAFIDSGCVNALAETIHSQGGEFKKSTIGAASLNFGAMTRNRAVKINLEFENQPYELQFVFSDEGSELVRIKCAQLTSKDWGPKLEIEPYQQRGEAFLQALMELKLDQANSMMHPALRQKFKPGDLEAGINATFKAIGALEGIEFVKSEQGADNAENFQLTLFFKLKHEQKESLGSVAFVFPESKGELVAFNTNE